MILRHSSIETQKRLNSEPQGVPEDRQGSIRQQIQFSIVWDRQNANLRHSSTEKQRRLNTERQGVPEDRQGSIR